MTNETIGGIGRLDELIGGDKRWDVDITGGTISGVTISGVTINASELDGTTLASNVVNSSLTSVGVLASPTITTPTLTGDVIQDVVKTSGSSGVTVKNSGGTTVAIFGSANTTNASLAGAVVIGGLITTTAGQIAFPATQNPSADPNTLDDYEEGTFTPAITFATVGNLSVSYSIRTGQYTKIGRMVYASFTLITSAFTHTTASGNLQITGFPFTSATLASHLYNGTVAFSGITKAGYTNYTVNLSQANTTATIGASGSGVGRANVTAADMPTGGTVELFVNISYAAS